MLGARKHAEKSSSFDEASSHYELGVALLGQRSWRDEYCLNLELFNEQHEQRFVLPSMIGYSSL
jgi:predicted ATPase